LNIENMKSVLVLVVLLFVGCGGSVTIPVDPEKPISESQEVEPEVLDLEKEAVEEVETQKEILDEEETIAYEAERIEAEKAQGPRKIELETKTFTQVKSGNFVGIAPGHNAVGGVVIKELGDRVMIELGEDFIADKGPDLYITLTQEQPLTGVDPLQLDKSKIKRIEPLTSRSGTQVYEVSKTDFDSYGHAVVVWCSKYNVVFGAAILE